MDPHITLLAPGRPKLPPEQAADAFRTMSLKTSPFMLKAHILGHFSRSGKHTLVLKVGPPSALHRLFRELITNAAWRDIADSTRRPYEPHITLANQLPESAAGIAAKRLRVAQPSLEFLVTSVVLYQKETSWPKWSVLAIYNLTE
jgi:2'-5' RNA ligase